MSFYKCQECIAAIKGENKCFLDIAREGKREKINNKNTQELAIKE